MKKDEQKFFLTLLLIVTGCLTLFFIANSFSLTPPVKEPIKLKKEWYSVETPRGELVRNAVILGNCWTCHATWVKPPDPEMKQPMFAHPEVKLDHGSNDRCFNCHSFIDRNLLQGDNIFKGIMFTNVEKLCGRCHGTVYRRWLEGTHGASRGKWSKKDRFDEKIKCTECHDPHSPKYKFTHIAPPPEWDKKYSRKKPHEEFENSPFSPFFPPTNKEAKNEKK